jgi:hypothetical protein
VTQENHTRMKAVPRDSRAEWLSKSDAALSAECSRDDLSGGGAGGQKRDRKFSGVRLRHALSGVAVVSTVSRSRSRNESDALGKLRMEIALSVRCEPPAEQSALSAAFSSATGRLRPTVLADAFDVLAARGFRVGDAARDMGISTGRLVRVLSRDKTVWRKLNEFRAAAGLGPLTES